jgi:hypothetical protein
MNDDKQPWPTLELTNTNTGRMRVMTSMPDRKILGEPLVGVDFAKLEQRVAADLANSVEALQGVYVPPMYIGDAATESVHVAAFLKGVHVIAETLKTTAAKSNFGYGTIAHQAFQVCLVSRNRNRAKKERRKLKGKK